MNNKPRIRVSEFLNGFLGVVWCHGKPMAVPAWPQHGKWFNSRDEAYAAAYEQATKILKEIACPV